MIQRVTMAFKCLLLLFCLFTNRSLKTYRYESLITGEIQDERPKDEEEEELEVLNDIERLQAQLKSRPDMSPARIIYTEEEKTDSVLTVGNSGNKEKEHKTIATSSQPQNILEFEQANAPQPVPPPAQSSPPATFPPLPPLPPKESPKMTLSEVPPLPSEDRPNDIALLTHKPPPPPPEISPCDEKLEQLNTSTSQVEDMDLSDGDDDCEECESQTNSGIVEVEEHISTHGNSEDSTNVVPPQMSTSQIIAGNIIYNNHPHMYQDYYQNYHQSMLQGQSSTGYPKDVNEKNVNPLNEALTSFYSDLASIDNKTSDADCDATQSKSLSHHYVADSSSELPTAKHGDITGTLPVPPVGLLEQECRFSSAISNPSVQDDNSNSPRSLTPDRGGQEEKEKRKKRAKLASGLSMKKKGVSNLVAKWQNIQEESSKQRPQ